MNEERPFTSAGVYQIRVKGHLDDGWSDWLEDLTLKREVGGMTLLVASVPDQPALYGLIIKIRDLGLELISVHRLSSVIEENPAGSCLGKEPRPGNESEYNTRKHLD
jgi:hypothetical protein